MKTHSQDDAYQVYASVYDAYKGDRSEAVQRIKGLIKMFRPGAKTVLDLACGTGAIMAGLAQEYTVTGLDNSPSMLGQARKKLPGTELIEADLTSFNLGRTFDAVLCLHNSINHLSDFSQWEQTFQAVKRHLDPGGIFIFDMNPPEKMDQLAEWGLGVKAAGEHYVLSQVRKKDTVSGQYIWEMDILMHQPGGDSLYRLTRIPMPVSSFSPLRVQAALEKVFTVSDSFVVRKAETPDDIGRAFFVCTKT